MIENRLPGETINKVWGNLSETKKTNITNQVVIFLQNIKSIDAKNIQKNAYSITTGKKYHNFLDLITDKINQKVLKIKKNKSTRTILTSLLAIINNTKNKKLFTDKNTMDLVHGDLIIHNLLTDGKNLTGVLDWELSLIGDSDYDLFRLFYYQECAKAYEQQKTDESFEIDYMNKLVTTILKSNLIKNKKVFYKKYQIARAIFIINALYWATNSNAPKKNTKELIAQFNIKSGASA